MKKNYRIFVRRGALILFYFMIAGLPSFAQFSLEPKINWGRSDWFDTHPVSGYQHQEQSGEDWWYDHNNSYDANGNLDGYICAGFSTFINYSYSDLSSNGCTDLEAGDPYYEKLCETFETSNNLKSFSICAMAVISPDGKNKLWHKKYAPGNFFKVIQTSDGGYLATGEAQSVRSFDGNPIYYNPNQTPGQVTNLFTNGNGCDQANPLEKNKSHIYLVKTDKNGNIEWQYMYGIKDYNASAIDAYKGKGIGFDVIETYLGKYRIVGRFTDIENLNPLDLPNPLTRGIMIEVASNGYYEWAKLYGPTDFASKADAIAEHEIAPGTYKYVVSGTEHYEKANDISPHTTDGTYTKVYAMQFSEGASPNYEWFNFYGGNTPFGGGPEFFELNASTFDIKLNTAGEILLPSIINCTGCIASGFNQGDGKVYRINPANGSVISTTNLGVVTAFDLKARVRPTADGGFAVVSSKHNPNTPIPPDYFVPLTLPNNTTTTCFVPTSFWRTDAYVSKCSANGAIEWEKTWCVDAVQPTPYPGDYKKQECLYSITEGPDGGFVISGNNSYNFDDCYLVKLNSDCLDRIAYDVFDPDLINDGVVEISQNTTWSSNLKVKASIRVQPGITLTITNGAVIEFADSKRISVDEASFDVKTNMIVMPGGRLVINNGARLTAIASCEGTMWDGIQVWGNPALDQTINNQGSLVIKNATIEHARKAVTLSKEGDCCGFNGGIIQASNNATFKNNGKHVEFMRYHRPLNINGTEPNNVSVFVGCNFICDAPLRDPDITDQFSNRLGTGEYVSLWEVKGVGFRGNQFINSGNFPQALKGTGIRSIDASYILTPLNSIVGSGPNVFQNLHTGIRASVSTGIANLTVSGNNFDNNSFGVILEGVNYATIIKNTFNIPLDQQSGINDGGGHFGIYTTNGTGFKIEQNNFNRSTAFGSTGDNIGIATFNSGAAGGSIYRNNFNEMIVGDMMGQSNNALAVDCNTYNALQATLGGPTTYQWAVTSGIIVNQGICDINDDIAPQANVFNGSVGPLSRQLFKDGTVPSFFYNSYDVLRPTNFSAGISVPLSCVPGAVPPGACLSTLGGIFNPATAVSVRSGFKQRIADLNALIDGNDTEGLLMAIDSATPGNIKNALLAASPYLSDRVLLSAIQRNPALSPGILKEILLPNSPLTAAVMESLQQINLPQGINNEIEAVQTGVSARKHLENEVAYLGLQIQLSINEEVRHYLDSNLVNSAIALLEQESSLEARCALVPIRMERKELVQAAQEISGLRVAADSLATITPTDPRVPEIINLCDYYQFAMQAQSRPKGYFEMTGSEEQLIRNIAESEKPFAINAQNILALVFKEERQRLPEPIIDNDPRMAQNNNEENSEVNPELYQEPGRKFSPIYPNPNNGVMQMEYALDMGENGKLVIYDITGRIINTHVLQEGAHTMQINEGGLANGICFYRLIVNNEVVNNGKLVIIK